MNEEERRIWQKMIDLQHTHIERLQKLMYWCVALFVIVTAMFTAVTINLSMQHRLEVTGIVHEYFYTDYDYGIIEQNVEVNSE